MKLIFFILILPVVSTVYGQVYTNQDVVFLNPPDEITFGIQPVYRQLNGLNGNLVPEFSGRWKTGMLTLSGTLRLNSDIQFLIDSDPVLIQIPDTVGIANPEELQNRPDEVTVKMPGQLVASYQINSWIFKSSHTFFSQSWRTQVPNLSQSGSVLNVQWKETGDQVLYNVSDFSVAYEFKSFTLAGGISSVPFILSGKKSKVWPVPTGIKPLFSTHWRGTGTEMKSGIENETFFLNGKHTFHPFRTGNGLSTSILWKTSTGKFSWQQSVFGIDYTINRWIEIGGSVTNTTLRSDPDSRSSFQQYLSDQSKQAIPLLPGWSVSCGISLSLNLGPTPLPVVSSESQLFQPEVFTAKRQFYSTNPVGTVNLYNPDNKPVHFRLKVQSRAGLADYESSWISVNPGDMQQQPFFFYLPESDFSGTGVQDQIRLLAVTDEQEKLLASWEVIFNDKNVWDGNTHNLRFFLTPTDPLILELAKRAYLKAIKEFPDSIHGNKIQLIGKFLDLTAGGFNYLPDPVGTIIRDRVQYPVESVGRKAGDCEDLVVFTASVLQAAGFDCAVIDIRPKVPESLSAPTARPGTEGHVMLLIDTGIPNRLAYETGLTDLQTVTRRNGKGEFTLWIPFETTRVSEGFETAFREGVAEYYKQVIVNGGMEKGHVQIYDF